jgi:hypothetical protein
MALPLEGLPWNLQNGFRGWGCQAAVICCTLGKSDTHYCLHNISIIEEIYRVNHPHYLSLLLLAADVGRRPHTFNGNG